MNLKPLLLIISSPFLLIMKAISIVIDKPLDRDEFHQLLLILKRNNASDAECELAYDKLLNVKANDLDEPARQKLIKIDSSFPSLDPKNKIFSNEAFECLLDILSN